MFKHHRKYKLITFELESITLWIFALTLHKRQTDRQTDGPYRDAWTHLKQGKTEFLRFLGSGPDRGQSPIEWGDFPFVRSSVCPFVHSSVCPFVRLSVCPFVHSSPPQALSDSSEGLPAGFGALPVGSEALPAGSEVHPA